MGVLIVSYKKHGHWVRLRNTDREGRVSYYDPDTRLVWVVWEPVSYTMNDHKYKVKIPSASGHRPDELVYTPYHPNPWFQSQEIGVDKTNQLV